MSERTAMADVKVTSEHVAAAKAALARTELPGLLRGEEIAGSVARELANAEHSVRAAVIAELQGLVDRAKSCDRSLYHVDAASLECLIEELESAQ